MSHDQLDDVNLDEDRTVSAADLNTDSDVDKSEKVQSDSIPQSVGSSTQPDNEESQSEEDKPQSEEDKHQPAQDKPQLEEHKPLPEEEKPLPIEKDNPEIQLNGQKDYNSTYPNHTESQSDTDTKDFPKLVSASDSTSTANSAAASTAPTSVASPKPRRSRRTPSIALSVSSTTSGNHQTVSASVFIKKAIETIKNSKDARKISALENSVSKAAKQIEQNPNVLPSPLTIFEPLKLVCTLSHNNDLKVVALDCIGKLFTFSYLEDPPAPVIDPQSDIRPPPVVPLIDQAVTTVCDCYDGDKTDPKVELQIIKALMAAVINEDYICHGATLLKALRQTYNVFVLSHSAPNQTIAQATLTQMMNVVFDRVKNVVNEKSRNSSTLQLAEPVEEPEDSPEISDPANELTLKHMERRKSFDVDDSSNDESSSDTDLFTKDAFLVFRTMCKLSEKSVDAEGYDAKSHGMRSKLLSLHLIHTILKAHMSVFTGENVLVRSNRGDERFALSIKDYICSSLARNAASISPSVFEISAEIFWLILSNLRSQFKREIQVFFAEIYFPIMEMKTSTNHQKQYLLSIIQRVCNDPRALVEIYLNYDCDRNSTINIYEKIIDVLVRMAVSQVYMTNLQFQQYSENRHRPIAVYNLGLPPALSINNVTQHNSHPEQFPYPAEYALKMSALESMVAVLRSLLTWSQRGIAAVSASLENGKNESSDTVDEDTSEDSGAAVDDPSQFETFKQRKTVLSDAIREFNFKPKRGMERIITEKFVKSREPADVAEFLATTEGLDKATLGEFLGESDPYHISVMHEFVNRMEFANMPFVESLRIFLQGFRLPGEGQKIDRFMLKFAERYISGNSGSFANADTAYILAYSTIMLNTDLHNPQNKRRMTIDDFVANNRGINDKKDLPREFLVQIYDEIQSNEIKLQSEQHAALLSSSGSNGGSGFAASFGLALATVGRDMQREAYMQASKEMSNKTENLFKSLIVSNNKGKKRSNANGSTDSLTNSNTSYIFYVASHIEHVKPMFEVGWMSFLAGLSGPFQESDEPETIALCLEGIRLSTRIACLFDLEYPRISFVTALAKFTNLQNLSEMKGKNVETVKVLLSIALSEGNMLKSSWKNVLVCISQLERFQLISAGIASGAIPDVTQARIETRASTESKRSGGVFSALTVPFTNHNGPASPSLSQQQIDQFTPEFGEEIRSREVVVYMDKIFTQSASLNGSAIQDFVKALIEVSWDEIRSSGNSENPRMFSLQKMVDVCYYNMDRIRVEWSQLWSIMGDHINKMGCHENANVVTFALDSLRQLSIRFFDLDELPHFKFQKDFLAPFDYVMKNNPDIQAKDMILQCLRQMILTKSDRIKSGWGAMFLTFGTACSSEYSVIVAGSFDLIKLVYGEYLDKVIAQDGFASLISCLSELAKNPKFQKTSLHALDMLNSTLTWVQSEEGIKLLALNEETERTEPGDVYDRYWFPVLASLHEVIMNGEDLEVRSRSLNYLFDNLVKYGGNFEPKFWDRICRQLLFPIFLVLKSRSTSNVQDDISVWLSTTMIQALRNMIALLTHYFGTLQRMLEGFLELLTMCIDQDNDTVSRIGSSCFLALVAENSSKFNSDHWHLIADKLDGLFISSTAEELFDNSLFQVPVSSTAAAAAPPSPSKKKTNLSESSIGIHQQLENGSGSKSLLIRFKGVIMKSIVQLLMIETADELLSNPIVFEKMPTDEILRVAESLRQSYLFGKKFNSNRDLRLSLWRQGFMKQMPNLHKQESTAAVNYVAAVMRLYKNKELKKFSDEDQEAVVLQQLMPLCIDVIGEYNGLEAGDQRHAHSLGPVVFTILDQYLGLDEKDFEKTIRTFYPHVVDILKRDLTPELREVIQRLLIRVGGLLET